MKLPQQLPKRIAALFLLSIVGAAIVITGLFLLTNSQKPKKIPIEQAMWVTDWEIVRIYGPGSPEQQKIVNQFGNHLEFNGPVLYRMGGSTARNPSEGILLYGFDPKHPEMAKGLATSQQSREK